MVVRTRLEKKSGPTRADRYGRLGLSLRQDLLTQDVGVPGMLCELAQHLQIQRPHRTLAATIDNGRQLELGGRLARCLDPDLVRCRDRRTVTTTTVNGELTSTVQAANLLNGLVKASVIKADARVSKTGTSYVLSDTGSSFGSLSVAGHPGINAKVAANTKVSLPGVGTLYLHKVTRTANTVTVIMIQLVLTNPVNGLAAGTEIRVATAYATAQ